MFLGQPCSICIAKTILILRALKLMSLGYDNQSAEGAGGLGIIRGNKVGESE